MLISKMGLRMDTTLINEEIEKQLLYFIRNDEVSYE